MYTISKIYVTTKELIHYKLMMRCVMNTKACEYIVAIAEKKNLSAAAASLGISQPTLSSFLSNTERNLKQTLFTRQKKEFVPTPAGQIYLEACREIIQVKNRTYQSMLSLSSQYTDRFTVGVTPHRGSTVFSKAFAQFYRRYPNIYIDIKEGYLVSLLQALDNHETDLVLGSVTKEDMITYNVMQNSIDELYLCVPDFHPLASLASPPTAPKAQINVERFQDMPFVMWGPDTTNRKVVLGRLSEVGMKPTIVYESNNVLLIDQMIQGGVGVGFLPDAYCRPNQHRVYFSLNPPLTCAIGTIYRKNERLTRPQRYFAYLIAKAQMFSVNPWGVDFNELTMELVKEFEEEDGWTPDN